MTPKELVKISKRLSLALRHQPSTLNLILDENGWASVSAVLKGLKSAGLECSRTDLGTVVRDNDKKRFAFSDDGKKIRASQGHSIEVDLELTPCEPPEYLFHGTSSNYSSDIWDLGLKKMKRQHVHLSADIETAKKVGLRHGGKLVIFRILAKKMHDDGFLFYQSENAVWLTDVVGVDYLEYYYSEPKEAD